MGIRSKRYLIVGDGAAGMTTARTLRETDPHAEITIVADDPNPAYFRAALTNYLLGELREEQIWATRPQFYDQYRVRRLHARCTGLDTQRGELHTTLGTPLGFDALLLGCGARARRPSFPGAELGGVLTLRTLQDCRSIMERILSGRVKNAVVLGGGPLALEWALGMHARGIRVSILLRGTSFLPGALDSVGSDLLAARLRQAGLNLVLGDEVAAATSGPDGNVAALTTKRGLALQCQMIAAAIGVVPNTEWLQGSGIQLGNRNGIVVNAQMQTSAAGVFAAGDVVEFEGRALQLWEPAQAQARVAGSNMIGTPSTYAPGVHYMATRLFDLDFASLGQITDVSGAREISDLPKGTGRLNYRKVVVKDGRLIGALMLGHREDKVRQRGRWFKRIMDHHLNVSAIEHDLLDPTFDVASWHDQAIGAANAALAVVPDRVTQGGPTGAVPSVAAGAALRGTNMLQLSQLTQALNSSPTPLVARGPSAPGVATTASGGAATGTAMMGANTSTAKNGGSPMNLAATAALGTQMLGQFNLRPAAAPAPSVKMARKAFLRLGEQNIELTGTLCRVGREAGSEIHITDPSVSFVHAHLQRASDNWYLRDLGSDAGTWVNGMTLSAPRQLKSGDGIRVGQVELMFFYEGEEQLARASAERRPHGSPKPRLQVRSGHALGLEFLLTQSPTLVGSDPSCQLWLDDTSLAPHHARLERTNSGWQVMCLEASAGLWINQRAAAPRSPIPLEEGTQVRIGGIQMAYTQRPVMLGIDEIQAQRQAVAGTAPDPGRVGTGQRMQAFAAVSADALAATAPPFTRGGGQPQSQPQVARPVEANTHASNPPSPQPTINPAFATTATAGDVPRTAPTASVGATAAPAASRVTRLRVESGPDVGRVALVGDYLIVGHQPNCQMVLSDQYIAPQQVEVQRFSGALFVRNLGTPGSLSKNGEDTQNRSLPLNVGDRLQLGPYTVLVFEEAG